MVMIPTSQIKPFPDLNPSLPLVHIMILGSSQVKTTDSAVCEKRRSPDERESAGRAGA
jgi:hypothetical protein